MPSPRNSPAETPYTRARDHLWSFRLYSRVHDNDFTRLAELKLLEFSLHRMRAAIVANLRDQGATWREIGEALQLTESQARHQYGGVDTSSRTSQN